MNETLALARLHLMLLESGTLLTLPDSATPTDRLGHLAELLMTLGKALRQELPDPDDYIYFTAVATVELALIAFPEASDAVVALDRLTALQRQGFEVGTEDLGLSKTQPADHHLRLAFWCLAGVAAEAAPGATQKGFLLEHAAHLANHLAFAVFSSGVWDLLGGEPSGVPRRAALTDSTARESSRAEPVKGDVQ